MKFSFTPLRSTLLAALVVVYALLGGMAVPDQAPKTLMHLWLISMGMFLFGAFSASVVDHEIGRPPEKTNIRWFYIVIGVCAMVGAMLYLRAFQERIAGL